MADPLVNSQVGLASPSSIIQNLAAFSAKPMRDWLFCLAFVCIGLDTNFRELLPYLKSGKPAILYLCGQALNLLLTLAMAYLMFGILFPQSGS